MYILYSIYYIDIVRERSRDIYIKIINYIYVMKIGRVRVYIYMYI